MNYPNTVIGTILRLSASFVNRSTNRLITMTGGTARVRVTDASNSVVLDVACNISGTEVYYEWDTTSAQAGRYLVQFEGTPPAGTFFIEPYDPISVTLGPQIGA